jgi:hypothetical protein
MISRKEKENTTQRYYSMIRTVCALKVKKRKGRGFVTVCFEEPMSA